MEGSAQDYHYKGAIRNLVSRGVVVVTIQYRLGLLGKVRILKKGFLGFFTTFSEDFPGNNAMLDQVRSLEEMPPTHFQCNNQCNISGRSYKIRSRRDRKLWRRSIPDYIVWRIGWLQFCCGTYLFPSYSK